MLKQALAPLVDLVFPPRCPLCGEGIGTQNGLCTACWAELDFPRDPSCFGCQRPLPDPAGEERAYCAVCRADPPQHDGVAAGTLYTDAARKLVLSFKHGRKIGLAPMLARLIAARLPVLEGEWIAVPVPLHRWRLWYRSFNQSALLARELGKLRGTEVMVDGLVRHKQTTPLGNLGRRERAQMLAGAITVSKSRAKALSGANVLLVDDVLTSGATTDACIAALRGAGAEKVMIACFSRVVDQSH